MKTNTPSNTGQSLRPRDWFMRPVLAAGLALCLSLAITASAQPTILTHPVDQFVSEGGSCKFTAQARTTARPLTMQWQHSATDLPLNFTNIAGGTVDSRSGLTTIGFTNATQLDTGLYRVVACDATSQCATSNPAELKIDPTFIKITHGPVVEDVQDWELGAWCDYDGDGLQDLFATSGYISPFLNVLYHQESDGSFTRVDNLLSQSSVNTAIALWADYDNDGAPDLLLTHWSGATIIAPDQVFRNEGGGAFSAGFTAGVGGTEAGWADWDRDGFVDLMVTRKGNRANSMYRNLGAGRFQELTVEDVGPVLSANGARNAPSFADFDNDGEMDVYLGDEISSGLGSPSRLYRGLGGGKFDTGEVLSSVEHWGGAWADLNNDGFFDLLESGARGVYLRFSDQGARFLDRTSEAGFPNPAALFPNYRVYGPAVGDFDNDGDLDVYVPYFDGRTNALYVNDGAGRFTSVEAGSPLREGVFPEGAIWVDYDNDGFLDLFVACGESSPSVNLLYRNNLAAAGNGNHWLKVKLVGLVSNRSAIGAKLRVKATIGGRAVWQVRQVSSDGGWAAGTQLLPHFGLGDATRIDLLRIEWPSGIVQELTNVAVDQKPYLEVVESQSSGPIEPLPVVAAEMLGSDGSVQVTLTCAKAGLLCAFEASTDLVHWTKLSVKKNTTGTVQFVDPGATEASLGQRFYRVIIP